jgi:Nucleotidyl transferase AbiEii toxin, Type IV TA system
MGERSRLAKEQRRALARLKDVPAVAKTYLAEGAAVGWHLGHRSSNDLDLFTLQARTSLGAIRRAIVEKIDGVEILAASDATLKMRLEDVPVDLVRYPYAPIEAPTRGPEGVLVAGLLDLAAMKLATIAGRGLRRDFWDVYAILKSGLSLPKAVAAYVARFGAAEPEVYHLARALTYFDDAEREEAFPRGLTRARWAAIRSFFRTEAPKLLR